MTAGGRGRCSVPALVVPGGGYLLSHTQAMKILLRNEGQYSMRKSNIREELKGRDETGLIVLPGQVVDKLSSKFRVYKHFTFRISHKFGVIEDALNDVTGNLPQYMKYTTRKT